MKQINIRLNINYILFIISYLKLYINCFSCENDCKRVGNDCVYKNNYIIDDSCSSCRPNLLNKNSEKCYSCTSGSGNNYYFENDISETCKKVGSCTNKNIYGSNQCVNSCGSYLYEMGKYCYSDCTNGNRIEVDSSIKRCKCRYLYYIKDNEYICLNQNQYCTSDHKSYDLDTKECSVNDNCGDKKKFTFHREGYTTDFIRCSESCLESEYIDANDDKKCVNRCDNYYTENKSTKEKKCTTTESCEDGYVLVENECVNKDECKYLNDDISDLSNCLSSCPNYITYKESNNYKYCSSTCRAPTEYISEIPDDKICLNSCSSNFYELDSAGHKKCVNSTRAQTCYFTETGNGIKKCLDECSTSGKQFHNIGSYQCISECTGSFPFHKEGEYICYESCDLIPGLGKNYIILSGNICDCILYAIEDDVKVCYNNEEECYSKGYRYKWKNQCMLGDEANCAFKVGGEDSNYLKKCFSSKEECSENTYYYYDGNTCWTSCPSDKYANPLDSSNLPKEDYSRHTCSSECKDPFPFYSTNTKTCKEQCDLGEYINAANNNKECLSSCDSEYIGENNECYSSSITSCPEDLYIIEKGDYNNKNKCVSQCVKYGKYYDSNITPKKCQNTCESKKYYNSDNQCLSSCSDDNNIKKEEGEIFDYVDSQLPLQPCLKSNALNKYYYYSEDEKKLYDTCDVFETMNSHKCSYCSEGNEYVYNNNCVSNCPLEAPYFIKKNHNFDKTDKNEHEIKKCVSDCSELDQDYKIIEYSNECVKECPQTPKKHVGKDNKCFIECGTNYFDPVDNKCVDGCPKYYEKSSITNNYICKSSCSAKNKYLDDKECVEKCPSNKNKVGLNNECKSDCTSDDGLYYMDIGNSMYKCLFSCPAKEFIYFTGSYECLKKCPTDKKYFVIETIENKYKCLDSCNNDYPYYLKTNENTEKNYYVCTDIFPCSEGEFYSDGECVSSCGDLKLQGKTCVENCNTNLGYTYEKLNENDIVIECKKFCDNDEYYSGNKCYDYCPADKPKIGKDKECLSECKDIVGVGIKFYYFSKPSNYEIYKCIESCPPEYPLLVKSSNQCVQTCDNLYLSSEENICYDNCLSSTINRFTLEYENTKKCFYKCDDSTDYKYYYQDDLKCLKGCSKNSNDVVYNDYAYEITNICTDSSCRDGYYKYTNDDATNQKKFCVTQCPPSDKPYLDKDNNCVISCNGVYKYYIKEFIHGETDIQKRCLNDCPRDYKFYVEKEEGIKECFSTCDNGYYVDPDSGKNATRCLPDCPNMGYKYKLIDGVEKKCVISCPQGEGKKSFHLPQLGSECLEKCPDFAKFHKNGDVVCYNEKGLKDYTDCQSIVYSSKECYSTNVCGNKKTSVHSESGLTVCLNECIPEYGEYLTPYNTCVKDCTGPELTGQFFINDIQNKKCICENFYYFNEDSHMKCIENSIGKKKCKYVDSQYDINMFGSKQCLGRNKCEEINGILSPSEDTCYDNSYIYNNQTCSSLVDKNSYYNVNLLKCECSYKFYYKNEEQGREKICLDENGECPLEYKKYVPNTKECIINCNEYRYIFNNLCLNYKPDNSEEKANKIVDCKVNSPYWYYDNEKSQYVCDSDCASLDYLKVPFTETSILCVKSCLGTHFPYYYNQKCYTSCANNDLLDIVNGFEVPERAIDKNNEIVSNYVCKCLNPWYNDKENNKIICSDSKYPLSIFDCKNFTTPKEFKYLVKHTLECIDDENCPENYPYHFNNECFKDCENDASSFYHYLAPKKDSYECECSNLWFINNSTNKSECIEIDINECIKFSFYLKYKINETRQCVSECPLDSWSFNYVCYNKCPENTTENVTDHTCICDTSLGYWYRYKKDNGSDYLRCVLEECPKENNNTIKHTRKNLVEENSQCLISCSENDKFKYSLRDICQEECPYFTDLNDEKDECVFFDLNNEINITNLTLLKDAANVQIKELYEGSEKLGGYLYNKFNASLHFYAINKNNSLTDISFKSNLTYIDLGTCLQKIYSSNEMYLNEDLKILVAKYDLLTNTLNDDTAPQITNGDKYLINKVEFELFSSNMSEKLEINGNTCDPYELIISYPLNLNRFNKYEGGLNQNEYRKRFEIGKKLYLRDNNIDTFNFNNTVYKDYCRSLEIDGKDLVYEDRYKYLYPNDKILCESNCIMNNTNFELERIVCLCSLKEDFNISRKDDKSIDIFNDPSINLPTQSKYNAEVVKCIFNFSLNETIIYNEAFYYSSIITAVQISMMFISGFSGVKNVIKNIRHLLSKLNSNKSFGRKNNKTKRIKFKNENIISTTNRPLNNPPKNDKMKEKYNEDIDFDSDEGDNNNNTILEHDLESNNNEAVNYEINIKKVVKPEIKDADVFDYNKNKKSSDSKTKSEYIPPEYNFKFFRPKDKGVMKKIERSQIPFEINPDTIYLIERRNGIEYPEDYLNGPYYPEQNLLIITEDKNKDVTKIAKKLKSEKFMNTINNDKKSEQKSQKISVNNKTNKSFYYPEKIGEKSFVTVKKINQNETSKNDENLILDELDENNNKKTYDDDTGLIYLIKREHIFLRVNYKSYIKKNHPYYFCVFLAEIFDKIYLFKICFLLRQSDIFSAYFTLYVFCHILLLTLLCNLFTVEVIKKIWERTDFPDLYFYLLYGLISDIIIWIVYLLLSFLINFEDSVRDITKIKYETQKNNEDDANEEGDRLYYKKYNCLICQIKLRVSILHIITFLITLCCGVYLVSFFSLYTGTKSKVLKIYYISIIEIVLIKVVYGVILASLRIVSKEAKLKILYTIIYILDKYMS